MIAAFADPRSGQRAAARALHRLWLRPRRRASCRAAGSSGTGSCSARAIPRTYTQPGTYTATVTATDDEGDKATKEVVVTVTAPGIEPPTVEATSDVSSGPAPLRVRFSATGDDPDGSEERPAVRVGLR